MVPSPTVLHVTLAIDGGFAYLPGLARPIALNAAQLGDEQAAQFQRLCESACAVAPKRRATRAAGVPDGRRYRLMVESGNSRHEVTAADRRQVELPLVRDRLARPR